MNNYWNFFPTCEVIDLRDPLKVFSVGSEWRLKKSQGDQLFRKTELKIRAVKRALL